MSAAPTCMLGPSRSQIGPGPCRKDTSMIVPPQWSEMRPPGQRAMPRSRLLSSNLEGMRPQRSDENGCNAETVLDSCHMTRPGRGRGLSVAVPGQATTDDEAPRGTRRGLPNLQGPQRGSTVEACGLLPPRRGAGWERRSPPASLHPRPGWPPRDPLRRLSVWPQPPRWRQPPPPDRFSRGGSRDGRGFWPSMPTRPRRAASLLFPPPTPPLTALVTSASTGAARAGRWPQPV